MNPMTLRLPPAMVDAIDALRAGRMDAPDRATVIRELLADALARKAALKPPVLMPPRGPF